jgi:hypothetical protein
MSGSTAISGHANVSSWGDEEASFQDKIVACGQKMLVGNGLCEKESTEVKNATLEHFATANAASLKAFIKARELEDATADMSKVPNKVTGRLLSTSRKGTTRQGNCTRASNYCRNAKNVGRHGGFDQ